MAYDINSVTVVGRLTREQEFKMTQTGKPVCKISIAVNKNKDEPDYFDVVIFDKLAEICNQYLSKGKQVAVNGRLVQNRWQDKEGNKRSKIEIIAKEVQFLGSQQQGKYEQQAKATFGGSQNVTFENDDMPF